MKIATKKKPKTKATMCLFLPPAQHMYTGQGVIISSTIKTANLCLFIFYFLPFDVQPQVIFPFEHCAIDAQHVVTAGMA